MNNNSTQHVDITPTPRILRTLGDIPFEAWQCIAELVDNSLDAFLDASSRGVELENPQIDITWSRTAAEAEVVIEDNGQGMTLETLQNAAKAGYSSNDPIHNLGLFGMGFNIATARLGDETVFLSTRSGDSEWVGIRIDFDELVKGQSFSAPVVREHKYDPSTSGTKILIRKLKDGVLGELKNKTLIIRRRLETIYTSIISTRNTRILLQGNQLTPRPHCVWSNSRYVTRKGQSIQAIQEIDRDLGASYFDTQRNRYLTEDESSDIEINIDNGDKLPDGIVRRSRRLKGWIGIQRYSHVSNFGVDFIRNGRKILTADKSIFSFENPATGTPMLEYPIELGSTVGGRIVGEIHVDYLIPTYQKNGFDTSGFAWRKTIEAIRGAGPVLPKHRKTFGYDGDNESPLGLLISGYRRNDPGTKCLSISRSVAEQFAQEFHKGNSEYQSDDKWYKAAQEADRAKGEGGGKSTTPVNAGDTASDDIDDYTPDTIDTSPVPPSVLSSGGIEPQSLSSTRDDLIQTSDKQESLSGKYAYGSTPPFNVTSWKIKNTDIRVEGERLPSVLFSGGIDVDFFYDETHPILAEYPITPKQLLLQCLAERFATRDSGISVQRAFIGLISNHLNDERVNVNLLKERAQAIMNLVRESLPTRLSHRTKHTYEILDNVPSGTENLASVLIEESASLFSAFQNKSDDANQCFAYVTYASIPFLVEAMPEEFLDAKVFESPYTQIDIGDEAATKRLQAMSLGKVVTYLRDTCDLLDGKPSSKYELIRFANTLSILEGLLTL